MKQTLPKMIPQCPDPVEGQFRAKKCVHLKDICIGRSSSEQRRLSRLFHQGVHWIDAWWLGIANALNQSSGTTPLVNN